MLLLNNRNLSINAYFNRLVRDHHPQYRFTGATRDEWHRWRSEFHPRAVSTLGQVPQCVPLNSQLLVEWREDGLIKQRVVFDVEPGLSVVAFVIRPEKPAEKLPAILVCHGHGPFGKEAVMGNRSTPEIQAHIRQHNYDYGLQMARHGFVTIAIDWRGFGERDDRRKPHWNDLTYGRDPCNLNAMRAELMGMTLLGMNVHDGSRAIDYLCAQPFVDAARVGAMGLSFGGTMTMWMAICDARIKAANIICYSDRFADFAIRNANLCGSQMTPALFALCDVPDLQGLIAPRPLLVEIGTYDECFFVDSAMNCFREVQAIYAAAGAEDKVELDLFEGGHRWGGNRSEAFFKKALM